LDRDQKRVFSPVEDDYIRDNWHKIKTGEMVIGEMAMRLDTTILILIRRANELNIVTRRVKVKEGKKWVERKKQVGEIQSSIAQVIYIRKEADKGRSYKDIATEVGLASNTVSCIARGVSRADVNGPIQSKRQGSYYPPDERECMECRETKPIHDFYYSGPVRKDGARYHEKKCKKCVLKRKKELRDRNVG